MRIELSQSLLWLGDERKKLDKTQNCTIIMNFAPEMEEQH